MGIKGLPQFFKQYLSDLSVPITESDVLRSRIAIDTGVFMHRFTINMHYPEEYVARFLQFALMLQNLGADFVFVFDGKPCPAKGNTLRFRREKRARGLLVLQEKIQVLERSEVEVYTQILNTDSQALSTITELLDQLDQLRRRRLVLLSRTIPVNRSFFYRLQEVFGRKHIPFFEADCEAEKACAWLAQNGHVDLVVTEDYDALVCGAPHVLRYWHHHDRFCTPTVVSLQSVLTRLSLTYEQFVNVCVLAGSDFAQSPAYLGFRKALSFVSEKSSTTSIGDVFDSHYLRYYESPETAQVARESFLFAREVFTSTHFPFFRNLLSLLFCVTVSMLLGIFRRQATRRQ